MKWELFQRSSVRGRPRGRHPATEPVITVSINKAKGKNGYPSRVYFTRRAAEMGGFAIGDGLALLLDRDAGILAFTKKTDDGYKVTGTGGGIYLNCSSFLVQQAIPDGHFKAQLFADGDGGQVVGFRFNRERSSVGLEVEANSPLGAF